jgi:hypothetical protein
MHGLPQPTFCCRGLIVPNALSLHIQTCTSLHSTHQGANSTAISCKQKLVVVVSVDSGDSIASQDVQFTLNCVGR